MNTELLLAAVYLRCSKDRRKDEASVDEQQDEAAADCGEKRWEPRWYTDNDRSASRYARKPRKDWERLLADLRDGQFGIIWLWETSRGDRKLLQWSQFLEECRDRGILIHVHTHHRTYDVKGNAADWRALASEGVDNAYNSDLTSLRIKRRLAAAARKGRPHGPVGYGYTRRYDPETRELIAQEPKPPESGIAAEIITRIAASEPLTAIKADLEARGIPGATGNGWDRQTMRQIALNPAYAGYRRLADGELVQAWPHVIPLETHLAAAAVLAGRYSKRPSSQRHLLSYLARCGPCGDGEDGRGVSLSACVNRYGTLMYKCRAHGCVNVAAAWLDEHVTGLACAWMAQPGAAEVYRSDSGDAAVHRAEAARLRAQLDEWLKAGVSARAYALKEAQLLPQIERAERAAARAAIPLVLIELLEADDVRAAWDGLGLTAQRDAIRALMDVSVARAVSQSRATRTDPERIIIDWRR